MIKYEDFGLPKDGMTRVELVNQYGTGSLHNQGWSAVGMFSATPGGTGDSQLYTVFRMTETEALQSSLEEASTATEKARVAESGKQTNDRHLAEALQKVVSLEDRIRELEERARDSTGDDL